MSEWGTAATLSLAVIACSSIVLADDPHGSAPVPLEASPSPASSPRPITPPSDSDQPADEIVLQDDRVLHGHVTALAPGEHVVIVDSSGEQTSVPWREIARADGPSFPGGFRAFMPVPPDASRALPQPVRILRGGDGRVPLRIDANQQVILGLPDVEVFSGLARVSVEGREICRTPCSLYVHPGPVRLTTETRTSNADYVVVRVGPSGTRALLAAPPPALGVAHPILAWGGFAVGAAGAGFMIAGFSNSNRPFEYTGITLASVGAVSFLTSLIVRQLNRVTVRSTVAIPAIEDVNAAAETRP